MKIFRTITFLFFASLLIVSCGDDETSNKSGLDGDWEALSFEGEVSSSTTFDTLLLVSTTMIEGSNLNYDLKLDDGNFTTSGGYDITTTANSEILPDPIVSEQSYSGISGDGTYTVEGDVINVIGQFFDFELDGVPYTQSTGPVSVNFDLDGDMLTFSQIEETTTNFGGSLSTTKVEFTSTWRRK